MVAVDGTMTGPGMHAAAQRADVRFEEQRLPWMGAPVRVLNARPVRETRARMVIVHGYGEHAGRYERLSRALAARDVAVTAFDLPGHGTSEDAPGELGGFESLDGLLTEVCRASRLWSGEVPLVVLGHSFGGLVTAAFAARHPHAADALVLSAPVLGRWTAIEAFEGVDDIPTSMVRARHLSSLASFAEEYDADPLIYRGPIRRSVLTDAKEQLAELASRSRLADQRMLWLHGSADRIISLADALRAFADLGTTGLAARIFAGARHEVFNDHSREQATELVGDFVLSLADPSSQTPRIGEST